MMTCLCALVLFFFLSFSQFSVRCKKEWLTIKSSSGGEPVFLCGSKLPQPLEFPGGNITLVHHFFPHLFPVSSFLLSFSRGTVTSPLPVCVKRSSSSCLTPCCFPPRPASGDCPETSFRCLGGQCIPPSWRCNGQVECLGEGLGSDELGCDEEVDYAETKTVTFPGRAQEITTERNKVIDKRWSSVIPDFWTYGGDQDKVAPEQPQTQKDLAVTPTPIEWPCGGLLQTFYGTFSPPMSHGQGMLCVWTLDPEDSRPLRLDLEQLVLGPDDRLTVYSREEGKGDILRNVSRTLSCCLRL